MASPSKGPAPSSKTQDMDDDVFGFFEDQEDEPIADSKQKKSLKPSTQQEPLLHIDLTENPTYLMHFCSNGFVWNEEVLLSPPFSSSLSSPPDGAASWKQQSAQSYSSSGSRVFPAHLAERLRRQRIAQETKVAEIHLK